MNNIKNTESNRSGLEEITARADAEEGWNDTYFKIISRTTTDNSCIYIAKGLFQNREVGFKVEIQSRHEWGISEEGEVNRQAFQQNGVIFTSLGKESDEFLKALSILYNYPTSQSFSTIPVKATVFSLNSDKVNLHNNEDGKFKLFFEENSEDLYSELYLNINHKDNILELLEKDEEYRDNIIRNFSGMK